MSTVQQAYEQLLGHPMVPKGSGKPEVQIKCFCHDDEHESCSVNMDSGGWYCYATGNKGYLPQAIATVKKITLAEAEKQVSDAGVVADTTKREYTEPEPIEKEIAAIYERDLSLDPKAREYAQKKLGWNPATIKKNRIGYAKSIKRYTIPIQDEAGDDRNIRMYSVTAKGTDKMISWKQGYGTARLFPLTSLDAETIILCEGEKDCILMNQVLSRFGPDDWSAITGTGGASSWRDTWNELFKDKDVVIIYDRDDSGITNAQKVAAKILPHTRSVKVVTLDISEPKGADITNYFQDSSKTWDDLHALIERTEIFTPHTQRPMSTPEQDLTVYEPHLSLASEAQYSYKRIETRVLVAGKELAPFTVPKKISYQCDMNAGDLCKSCSMDRNHGVMGRVIKPDDPLQIEMIDIDKKTLSNNIKRELGIQMKCRRVVENIEEFQNLEQIILVPEIDFSEGEKEHVSRTGYSAGHGVRANASYNAYGTTLPHPKNQHTVHFFSKMTPAQDNIDDFKMNDKKLLGLKIFQVQEGQSIEEKMDEIAMDLSLNVTKIYGRNDLIKSVDLCYHTVLGFDFQGKAVAKAWGDILILGDTRTGKTETVQAMIYHYKLGEMSVGENTSFAGLVGGLKQSASRAWSITWGRIPLNNRRLLVIDEASGLHPDTISDMSGIRSNGVAELTKIETQRTMARTRLIWLSNPRAAKSMKQYGHGVDAVRELIGRPEDIARFDFAVASATNEVPVEEINAKSHPEIEHRYTSDLCRNLVLWAWSRGTRHVVFTEGTTEKILDLATEQSRRYASDGGIPLVEGGNHRIKLAKLAVAAACRVFSTEDGETVLVKPEHAEYAHLFLDQSYSKGSLDYAGWSDTRLAANQMTEQQLAEVEEWVREHRDWAGLWMSKDNLRLDDFRTLFDLETNTAKSEIFAPLAKMKMIDKGPHSTFSRSPAFIQVLKKVLREPEEEAKPDDVDGDIPF